MINQDYYNRCLRLGLLLSLTLTTNTTALAQVTSDQTLGTQVIDFNGASFILGGTTVGKANLFHSFSSFSIPDGGGAFFLNDSSITNIFARVTGGTASNIQGLIRAQGNANLFLMNPNGIIFGRNAQLNIGGSFVATTGNAIQFPNGAEFSSTSPVAPENTLLSVNPTAFLFNQIANQGINSIENKADFLLVPDGKSLILLGGRVAPTPESNGQILMDGGKIGAFSGSVKIGGLTAPGIVGLKVDGDNLQLSFPKGVARTDVSLINNSVVITLGAGGGDIVFNTNNFNLANSSFLFAGIDENAGTSEIKAGDISVNATGVVTLNENSGFLNSSSGVGDGGNINIFGQSLKINNSSIRASAVEGNSGVVNILVDDTVSLLGIKTDDFKSVIASNVLPRDSSLSTPETISGTPTRGRSGGINIKARNLLVADGALINANNFLAEDSGDIKIQASDAVNLKNYAEISTSTIGKANAGNISITTNYISLADNSQFSTTTYGSGNGGNITIDTRGFEASNGGLLITGTFDSGKSGDIAINATDSINIFTNSDKVTGVFAGSTSSGNGGRILLSTTDFNLFTNDLNLPNNLALVSTRSVGGGIAGDINIIAKGNYRANNGLVSARAEQAGGGNINITAKNISLRHNSDIRTDLSTGQGSGGNITLSADSIIALEDSDILAFAPEGQGGNITFNTRALLTSPLYSPTQSPTDANSLQSLNNNNRVDINASGAISGNIIGVPDITFLQNSLTQLQVNFIDTNALIANSCIARSPKQEGTFLITGAGSLPTQPGEPLISIYFTGNVRNVNNNSATRPWKKGDPIVEPEGVYRLTNGKLVMSRECR